MGIIGTIVTVIVGLVAGLCVGLVGGFGLAANAHASSGVSRAFSNPILRWIGRPTNNLSFVDAVLYLILIAGWLVIFFALCATPFLVAAKLSVAESLLLWVATIPLVAGILLGKVVGKNLWLRVPTSEA